jgi:NAD-dependent SIR2 family protein deacetylase
MGAETKYIGAPEFVRRFKQLIIEYDAKFCFFLGAGCSVWSGIPTAGSLVDTE